MAHEANWYFTSCLKEASSAMCRQRFANREISWMFDQMRRNYPDSPSKVWQRRTGLEEPPEVRAEEEKYRARIQNGLDLTAEYLMDLWSRGK